jgi:hypothetical protein
MPTPSIRTAGAAILVLAALAGCKSEKPAAPPPRPIAAAAPSAPVRTREQAMAELMALPELKAWSAQIEKSSHGSAHGAVIEDDPAPLVLNGKPYYQLSFVENRKQDVHRRASFLVGRQDDDILVEDDATDSVQSLGEWRRNIRKVELKSG